MTVVRLDQVTPWRNEPEREFQFGEWLRREYEAGLVPAPQRDHDLAPLVATVLMASEALIGPDAGEPLDPVPQSGLVSSMCAAIPSLIDEVETDTTNVLLTLARMWHTKETGRIATKDAAASWVLERMPVELRRALEHARTVCLSGEEAAFHRASVAASVVARHLRDIICM